MVTPLFAQPFRRGDQNSDFVLVCHGQEFKVHTLVLCNRIHTFKVAVDECVAKHQEKRVSIFTTQPHILERYLDAMYTGDYSDTPVAPAAATQTKSKQTKSDKSSSLKTRPIAGAALKPVSETDTTDDLLERLKINIGVLAIAHRYSTYEIRVLATKKYAPQLDAFTKAVLKKTDNRNWNGADDEVASLIALIKTVHEGSMLISSAAFDDFFHALLLLLSGPRSMATAFTALRTIHPRLEEYFTTFVWSTWIAITRKTLEHEAKHDATATAVSNAHVRLAAAESASSAAQSRATALSTAYDALAQRAKETASRAQADIATLNERLASRDAELASLRANASAGILSVTMPCGECGASARFMLGGHIAASRSTCEAGHQHATGEAPETGGSGGVRDNGTPKAICSAQRTDEMPTAPTGLEHCPSIGTADIEVGRDEADVQARSEHYTASTATSAEHNKRKEDGARSWCVVQ